LILSYICKKWIHKRCSSVKARQSFICRCYKVDRPITVGLNTDLAIGNGASLEKADKF